MKLLKENLPFALNDAFFIDEYRLLGAVPSQGDRSKYDLALWDTSHKNPSPVRFETEFPLTQYTRLCRNRESNPELPFHGDLSAGIVGVVNHLNSNPPLCNVAVIRVGDLITLSGGCEGKTVPLSKWKEKVTNLGNLPSGFSVLHSQVAYVQWKGKTLVLYVHDFSRHFKWKDESNPKGPLELTPRPTPKISKQITLSRHGDMGDPSEYRFTVTEGGVYALPVSS